MPELREVFEMTVKQMGEPDLDAWRVQEERQRRSTRNKRIGALAVAATIVVATIALVLGTLGRQDTKTPGSQPPTGAPVDAEALAVATGFVQAYSDFDVERAFAYLADGVDIEEVWASGQRSVQGTRKELRMRLSFLEATGYEVMLDSCEELSTSATLTRLRCRFDYHELRSDELGLGPFSGSYFDLDVRDGRIVRASKYWETEGYSAQVFTPFTDWVSTTYPGHAKVMWEDDYSVRLTEDSIRLWERHSRMYVKEAGR